MGADEGRRRREDRGRQGQDRQADATVGREAAASDADWAENGVLDAFDFAEWAAYNAELAVLDAIDARAYADELASAARS